MAGGKQQKGRQAAGRQVLTEDIEDGFEAPPDDNSDHEDGESLKKILGLVSAQFKKKNTDRAKRAESEHVQQLEKKAKEARDALGLEMAKRQDRLENTKRDFEGQIEESGAQLKKLKAGIEKSLDTTVSMITKFDTGFKNVGKVKHSFFSSFDNLQNTQQAEAIEALKVMKKQLNVARQEVAASTKDTKDYNTLKSVFITALGV
ncbi:hypothetical protein DFJ74DRAFT_468667 [Hyaloraphidium curvatum]|nr:hypothetical protein DFJ74DRAFT_468667 [Hyaloraphidium curvatum]